MPKASVKTRNLTIFLGHDAQREQRLEKLERLALDLVGTSREDKPAVSRLLQAIADGEIELVPKQPKSA